MYDWLLGLVLKFIGRNFEKGTLLSRFVLPHSLITYLLESLNKNHIAGGKLCRKNAS